MTEFKSRDLFPIAVGCDPIVFIVSLNDDDENETGAPDYTKTLPLTDAKGALVEEDNLRQFDFNLPNAAKVEIAQVVELPTSKPAVGKTKRVRAYESDKKTPFKFGKRQVPVTMYLEGVRQPSAKLNDIGFEYQYFKDQDAKVGLCGGTAIGTVVKVAADFKAESSGGASFKKKNKMLIVGEAVASAKVIPAEVVTPEWSTDDPLGTFSAPQALQTDYEAGPVASAAGSRPLVKVKLTGVATKPPGQVIEASIPVIASAPSRLRLKQGAVNSKKTAIWADPQPGTLDLIDIHFPYEILDQEGALIHADVAYAKRVPAVRENIRAVLTSPLPAVQAWIAAGLKATTDWIDKANGEINDHIEISGLSTDLITTSVKGRRSFDNAISNVGDVLVDIPAGSSHIWYLGVRKPKDALVWGVVPASHNQFSATVTKVKSGGGGTVILSIQITSFYQVVLP
jgi:hypothetical protein